MPCYYPVPAFQSLTPGQGVTFKRTSHSGEAISLPCGRCIGCRLDRSRDWSTRLVHENQMHTDSMFLTLTYAPDQLPPYGSLNPVDMTNFLKRYRKSIYPHKIRFFQCGEYGEQLSRPHHHALIFGHRFDDLTPWRKSKQGHLAYRSETLERLWSHGICEVGTVTQQSCGYVARYIMKKQLGNDERAIRHYERVDPETGEVFYLHPEYVTMSRRPGIGKTWFDQFGATDLDDDFVVIGGKKTRVPRYYMDQIKAKDERKYRAIKRKRAVKAKEQILSGETHTQRLIQKENCKKGATALLNRSYEK